MSGSTIRPSMGWPLPVMLAARYLKSSRRDAYVTFLSLLATGGIALGVAALVLVLAGLSGLQDFLRSDVLSRTPHLEVELPPSADAAHWRDALINQPGVEAARLLIHGRGWLLLGGSSKSVQIVGFEGELPAFFPRSQGQQALALTQGVFLGDLLAARWALEIGDKVELVSPRPTLTPLGPQPRLVSQRIAGTFETGRTEDEEPRLAVPLPVARRLFGDRLQRIEIRTTGLDQALDLAPELTAMLPEGAHVRTWEDLNRGLFFALKLEKRLMFAAVFLIVPVAGMALVTALALLISSKRAEVGMLGAMGATPVDMKRVFLVLGTILASFGLLLGALVGGVGAWALDRFEMLGPPGDVYFIDHIPFLIQASDLLWIFGATLAFTLACTWYAARRAAALKPIEALTGRG